MKTSYKSKTLLYRAILCLGLSLGWPGFSESYIITDLNGPGDVYRLAHGLNKAGDVVGEYTPTNSLNVRAFLYHQGASTDLGVLPSFLGSYAYSLNDTGQIAGWSYSQNLIAPERAFLDNNGSLQNLGTLGETFPPGGGWSEAYAVNGSGEAVGAATGTNAAINHAVLWRGGTSQDLGSLGGPDFNSSAYGINNLGVIVGESEISGGSMYPHAFSYSNNMMTDLGTLPGGGQSQANAVNDSGVIVGQSQEMVGSALYIRAFVCSNGPGSMQDLGTFGGFHSFAYGINSAGRIVGEAQDSNNVSRAFLYDGSKLIDLNNFIPPGLGWTNLEAAVGINDAGQIAGYGQFADGVYHAFLLTPAGPLTVTITNPAPNSTFTAPATFVVGASVTDTAGTVTNVQFRVDGSMIGEATSAPYGAMVSGLGVGTHILSAVAADNGGLKATNTMGITVSASLAPIVISNPAFSGGAFTFSFGTQNGVNYAAQFTTPLSGSNTWQTFTSLSGNGSPMTVTDPNATNGERYYRVIAQ